MSTTDPPKAEEIPLEDIDKLLAAEDPEFTKSLEEVRNVETDTSIAIEATAPTDTLTTEERPLTTDKPLTGWRRRVAQVREAWFSFRQRLKAGLRTLLKDGLIFLKTKPKEFALYSVLVLKLAGKKSIVPILAFRRAEPAKKGLFLLLLGVVLGSLWILLANFKGIWLPQLTEPILSSFEPYAEWVETYNPKEEGVSFYTAFPQERYEFLFHKIKVNLKRTAENPLPMGAFEIIVLLDSKDTAIEVRDREVEFFDLLQRVFEEETFADLATELGKTKLKSRLKREMNQTLTQGWVKDINFKTFILKP